MKCDLILSTFYTIPICQMPQFQHLLFHVFNRKIAKKSLIRDYFLLKSMPSCLVTFHKKQHHISVKSSANFRTYVVYLFQFFVSNFSVCILQYFRFPCPQKHNTEVKKEQAQLERGKKTHMEMRLNWNLKTDTYYHPVNQYLIQLWIFLLLTDSAYTVQPGIQGSFQKTEPSSPIFFSA